jgi:hypothetical protein
LSDVDKDLSVNKNGFEDLLSDRIIWDNITTEK